MTHQTFLSVRPTAMIVAVLLAAILMLTLSGAASDRQQPLFQRLAAALESAPPASRSRFASGALTRLADAYLAEARMTPSDRAGNIPTPQWSRAVEGYAHQILRLRERIHRGAPVTLLAQSEGAPLMIIDDYQVMLSHPRPEQQATFEHLVVEEFCTRDPCAELLGSDGGAGPGTAEPLLPAANPRWEFTASGPACSHRGLRIAFDAGIDFEHVRATCGPLFRDIEVLLALLSRQRQLGVNVEPAHLVIEPMGHNSRHLVQINRAGHTAVADLPALHLWPDLLPLISSWLRARLDADSYSVNLKATAEKPDAAGFRLSPAPH